MVPELVKASADYKPVSRQETVKLIRRVRRGDAARPKVRDGDAAREKLITQNIRLVTAQAAKFANGNGDPERDDLIAEGLRGLNRAIDGYRPEFKTQFSTYAVWWIRHYMHRHIHNAVDTIRTPVYQSQLKRKRDRATAEFMAEQGRRPSNDELCRASGLTKSELTKLAAIPTVISLDARTAPTRTREYIDDEIVEDKPWIESLFSFDIDADIEIDSAQVVAYIRQVVATKLSADIVLMYFGLYQPGRPPMTYGQISNQVQMKPVRIGQIVRGALRRLRSPYYADRLRKIIDGQPMKGK